MICKEFLSILSSFQVRLDTLTSKLDDLRDEMRGKHLTLQALEEIRGGILSGRRIELPSAQRQESFSYAAENKQYMSIINKYQFMPYFDIRYHILFIF